MKTIMRRILLLITAVSILLCAGSCSASGYTVTGEIEDGTITVWLSPLMSSSSNNLTDYIPVYTGFPQDVTFVTFHTDKEFSEALTEKILTNDDPPDVILATPRELNSKMFESEIFMDLTPFLEYAYRNNTLDEDDILTNVLNVCKYDGKQYILPISFSFDGIYVNTATGDTDGLSLSENSSFTPDELLQEVNAWVKQNGTENSYKITDVLPPVYEAFDNLIDYTSKTTRMGEDEIYEYFCKYVEYKKEVYEEYGEKKTMADMHSFLNNSIYKSSSYAPTGYTLFGEKYKCLPYYTESKTGMEAIIGPVAAIPANAQKKEKAFAFISTILFNKDWLDLGELGGIPLLKSYVKETLKDFSYIDDSVKDELYEYITTHDFITSWQDQQIIDWFDEYCADYYNSSYTVDEQCIVPTREEWNTLKQKIETYLDE